MGLLHSVRSAHGKSRRTPDEQKHSNSSALLYPRVFAVDLHDVDSDKFQDSRNAGFSWYVLLTTLLVSLSAVSIGWSIGVVNVSRPIICQLHPLGPSNTHVVEFPRRIPFSDSAWTIAVGILSVGGFLGALVSGAIADSIGRRNALVVNNGLYIAGAVLMGTATTVVHFTLGRFVMGIGCGVASGVVNTYIGEIAPFRWRGFYGSFFQLSVVLGILFSQLATLVGPDNGIHWRMVVSIPGAFSLLQIILLPLRVESPSYLLKVNHVSEARHALLTLRRGYDVTAEWQETMHSLEGGDCPPQSIHHQPAAEAEEKATATGQEKKRKDSGVVGENKMNGNDEALATSSLTFAESTLATEPRKHIFGVWATLLGRTRDDLRHLVACCVVLMLLVQLTGISTILFSDSGVAMVIFDPGSPLSAPWGCVVVCGVSIPATFLCLALVDRLGRRAFLLGSLGGMAICCVLISTGLFFAPSSMVMAAVFLCYFLFNMGVGVIPWFYISEAIPSYSRAATTVLCASLYWATSIAISLLVPIIENLIPQWLFTVFGSFALAGFFVVMLFVPETVDSSVTDVAKKHAGNIHLVVKLGRRRSPTGGATTASNHGISAMSKSLLDMFKH
ncbi:Bifunctional purine biosynthesis protein PurH [Coemansia sp. RSA 552]|nr:Bifunctional purine biosynthesis protein PurH [Coemansia sp. RSA 552]